MNPHELLRLFPLASKSVVAANACDYGTGVPDGEKPSGAWKDWEITALRVAYSEPIIDLHKLVESLGRSRAAIACKANELKISVLGRSMSEEAKAKMRGRKVSPELREAISARNKKMWAEREHPRGFKDRKHTEESKAKMGTTKGLKMSPEVVCRGLKTKYQRYGCLAPNVSHGSWKAAWREIGGKRLFARSKWEANYAHYLEFLKQAGEISEWEHEPETFWFDKIKRGTRSYLPDFRVTNKDGTKEYHEVKGWMDDRSKTKLRRMKKYHPRIVMVLRDSAWFKMANRKLRGLVPNWEQ